MCLRAAALPTIFIGAVCAFVDDVQAQPVVTAALEVSLDVRQAQLGVQVPFVAQQEQMDFGKRLKCGAGENYSASVVLGSRPGQSTLTRS